MVLSATLERLVGICHYPVLRSKYTEAELSKYFVGTILETPSHWLIPCTHSLHSPASEKQIAAVSAELDIDLPENLQNLLRVTDGADLFVVLHRGYPVQDYPIAEYRILSCSELVHTHREQFEVFQTYLDYDDKYDAGHRLNYLSFCDIGDGNLLAVCLEGEHKGTVFFLDHDYGFYPFGDEGTLEAYEHIAGSITEWLDLLINTEGREGMGRRFSGL